MFAGIVEEIGQVRAITLLEGGVRLTIAASVVMKELAPGDSIAIDGVCQTVVARDNESFTVEAIATTLSRTTLGALQPGDEINLERALAYGARVGGHLVQGHVDGVGRVHAVERRAEHVLVDVHLPAEVADVTVLHGSIAVNGVSLTVNAMPADDVAQVALIPYTWNHTGLRRLQAGARVNVEGDMLGKFIVRYLERRGIREGQTRF